MKGDRIAYQDGYKYQLAKTYAVQTDIIPMQDVVTEYILLGMTGWLTIMEGYAWDGPSGPTFDTPDFMRGSLVHDALYQLMRQKHLDPDIYRERADNLLRSVCLEDGMPHFRAQYVYEGVRAFGSSSADPANDKPIIEAP